MSSYEFRSQLVDGRREWRNGDMVDSLETICNAWAAEGFIVFSVVCPNPSNHSTYRLTAKRSSETTTQEKFEL